ncbi:MAG: recombinase family protein, partial [candidate division Zixibacteria bacterium HGW-Zixibacteria-1]
AVIRAWVLKIQLTSNGRLPYLNYVSIFLGEDHIYARVSSKEQEKEGYSIPSQLKLLRNYANEKRLAVDEEFIDVETAKVTGRTGFDKMLTHLRRNSKEIVVLVEKTDRLYRNIKDWVTLDELDAEIHFVKENFILSSESKSSEKFLHGIKVLMAKNYIDNLSEEVKKGQVEKAEQGEWPSKAPVGYLNNKETHCIEPDPNKGPFIKRLFEWYASGENSLEKLAIRAKESGLFSRNSMTINKAGIHRILKNPIYHGEFVWKNKRYFGCHRPLISKELFDRVQATFQRANHPKETKRNIALAGLIKCGKCGCSMTPEIKKGKYIYYHCTQYKGTCDNIWVREEDLIEMFASVVKQVRVQPNVIDDLKKALLESQQDRVKYHQESIASLRRKYDQTSKMLDRAYEDKLNGTISAEMWKRKSTDWENKLVDIQSEINSHQNANSNFYQTGLQILELANSAYDMYLQKNKEEKRYLLDILLSNCTFYRGTLCPTYKKPFDILAKGSIYKSKRG